MSDFLTVLQSPREEDVQQYLTQHYEILLAAFGSHWYVNLCIPRFEFGTEFVSDFVIVTGQLFHYDTTLIELESPTVRPFTKTGKYARRLNDALGQINDWFVWIHENGDYFRKSLAKHMYRGYDADEILRTSRIRYAADQIAWHPFEGQSSVDFICAKIVIGRRDMLSPSDNKRRAAILKQSSKAIEIIPYDRLVELECKLRNSDGST